jgi:hypothetical protein
MTIVPLVEGPGDVEAVPLILRRMLYELIGDFETNVSTAMKVGRCNMLAPATLQRHIKLAQLRPGCGLIIVVLDRDDDDCRRLLEALKKTDTLACARVDLEFLVIDREFEAWLLASMETLRGNRGISGDATVPENIELKRDCKGPITERMNGSTAYSETADQAKLTASIDLALVHERCHSFRKFLAKLRRYCNPTTNLTHN